MNNKVIQANTHQIVQVYQTHQPIEKDTFSIANQQEAYAIQHQVTDSKLNQNNNIAGYKIGLASEKLQAAYSTDAPIYGVLTDNEIKNEIHLKDYMAMALEFELFFIVDETIHAKDNVNTIMKKCRVAPGFELPDGRYHNWFGGISLYEFIADGSGVGAVTIGQAGKYTYQDIDDIYGSVTFNGKPYKEGRTKAVLGHPVNTVKWLAQAFEAHGHKLQSGTFVASGSINTPSLIEPGVYEGTFEKIGSVKLTVKA